jgi:hypothetical protein
MIMNDHNDNKKVEFKITEKGSLGLLAYGDIGLREWRKVKKEFYKKESE